MCGENTVFQMLNLVVCKVATVLLTASVMFVVTNLYLYKSQSKTCHAGQHIFILDLFENTFS